jgi:membrane fusion protein, multidrug efflux system
MGRWRRRRRSAAVRLTADKVSAYITDQSVITDVCPRPAALRAAPAASPGGHLANDPSLPMTLASPRLALVAAIAALSIVAGCSRSESAPEPVRAVRTQVVTSDSAGGALEYAAEVKARTESQLGFRVGGKIARRSVELGERVKAGQLLAQLDAKDLRLGQDAARAALAAAQVNLDQAAADLKRYRELKDQGFIGAAELERRETTLKAAQSALEQARAQAGLQGNQAAYADLLADAPGVVTAVAGEPGMVVAAGAPVVRLAVDGPRDVVFAVPEDKVGLLRMASAQPGALKVRLWNHSDALPATLREVSAAADPATRTFLAKADIGRADVQLGQTATVLLELPRQTGVTRLPLAAVAEQQGKTVVWVLDRTTLTVNPRPVAVAGADGNTVVVAAGLEPGQTVVTAGVHLLTPGQKVKLYAEPPPPASAPASGAAR